MEDEKLYKYKNYLLAYRKTKAFSIPWCDLKKWFDYQEETFNDNKFKDDDKIKQIILNLDVRHWKKLNKILKSNLQPHLSYDQLKSSLLIQPIDKKSMPKFNKNSKYDSQIDSFVDKLNLTKINFESFLIWLKRLRGICNGTIKDDYLSNKILYSLTDNNKLKVATILLVDLKKKIDVLEKLKKNTSSEKNKELSRLLLIKDTIKNFLDNI